MTADRLAALVSEILVDMEEAQLCADCIADACEEHDEMPETSIGCNDAREIATRLAAAGVTVAQPAGLDVEAYREGLAHAKATYGPGHRAAAIAEVRQAVAALRIEPDDYRAAWQHNMTLDEVQAELDRLDNLPAAAIAREYGAPQPAPDALRAAAQAVVTAWGPPGGPEWDWMNRRIDALRAALGDKDG